MGIRGHKAHLRRLRQLSGPEPVRLVGKALFAAAEAIAVDAQISITNGAVSGKGHVPSKPGEPPNADTHDLANRIEAVQRKPLVAAVESTSDHAMIEFDWGKVAARPYLRPARDKNLDKAVGLVEDAMRRAVRMSRSRE